MDLQVSHCTDPNLSICGFYIKPSVNLVQGLTDGKICIYTMTQQQVHVQVCAMQQAILDVQQ